MFLPATWGKAQDAYIREGLPFGPGIDGRLADGLSPGNRWKYDPTSACHRATVGNKTRATVGNTTRWSTAEK